MISLLPELVLLSSSLVLRFSSQASCTLAHYNWSTNSLNQDPCVVAQSLSADFSALVHGTLYENVWNNAVCCNTVSYSLISACAACRDRTRQDWVTWCTNCTATPQTTQFIGAIPTDTVIPDWAYMALTNDTWDPFFAYANASLALSSVSSTFTSASITTTPAATSATSPGSRHNDNTGAIAGEVVGGIACGIVAAAIVFWVLRRYRRKRTWASAEQIDTVDKVVVDGEMGEVRPRCYDPLDATTYNDHECFTRHEFACTSADQ